MTKALLKDVNEEVAVDATGRSERLYRSRGSFNTAVGSPDSVAYLEGLVYRHSGVDRSLCRPAALLVDNGLE